MFKSKKFKHGSLSVALTIGFIAIVVVINIIAGLLVERFPAKLDLTKGELFEIGDDTKDILSKLDKDIEVNIIGNSENLESSSVYFKQIAEIINLYPKYSNHISVKWVDLDKNPEFANKYAEDELEEYDVIIESDLRKKIVNLQDMLKLNQQMYTYYMYGYCTLEECIEGSTAEQEMTSAIMYVTDDNPVKVAFLNMGEETDNFSVFREQLLGKNAYETVTVNVLTEQIPEDAQIAVVCAPSKDYSVNEISKLEAFLDNKGKSGKSVFYIASAKNTDTPILDEFLRSWGIEIGDEFISETDPQSYYQIEYYTWQNIETTDYAMNLSADLKTVLVHLAHPVTVLYDAQVNTETQPLVTTNKTAQKVTIGEDGKGTPVGNQGIMNSAVVAVKTNYENSETKSYVYAFGSEYMFQNSGLTTDNAEYILSLFNTNTGKAEGISIISKSFESEKMELSAGTISALSWMFILIIPAIVIVIGIVVAVKRKNR